MRAVAVRAFKAVPELMDLPVPVPAAGEVLVRMEGAGVNPFDWKVADGILSPRRPHVFPLVVGMDGAGRVEQLGPRVQRLRVGDRILGHFLHDPVGIGTYAEFSTVPESNAVARIPESIDALQAAAIPTAGMTAQLGVDTVAEGPGRRLLLVGATGGVGSFAIQLAAARGLQVTAITRAEAAPEARELGAEEVVDPGSGDVATQIRSRYPEGVDALLDMGSDAQQFGNLARLVRRGGVAATTTFVADPPSLAADGVRAVNIDMHPNAKLLERVMESVRSGALRVRVATRLRLEDAPAALADSRARKSRGKVVIALP